MWKKGYLGPKEAAGQNATLPAWYRVNCFLNEFSIEFANDFISLITGIGGRNIFSEPNSNPTYCTILDNSVFENFISADTPFVKALWIFETYVSVNSTLYGKLASSLEFLIKFEESYLSPIFYFTF